MSGDVKAVLVVVLVVLVSTDQHVGKARLADPRRTHDQDSRARILVSIGDLPTAASFTSSLSTSSQEHQDGGDGGDIYRKSHRAR